MIRKLGYASGIRLDRVDLPLSEVPSPAQHARRINTSETGYIPIIDDPDDPEELLLLPRPSYPGQIMLLFGSDLPGDTFVQPSTQPYGDLSMAGQNLIAFQSNGHFALIIGVKVSPTLQEWRVVGIDGAFLFDN